MDPDFASLFPLEHDFQFHQYPPDHAFDGIANLEDFELPDFGQIGADALFTEDSDLVNFESDGYFQSAVADDGCSCCTRSSAEDAGGAALGSTDATDIYDGILPSSPHSGNLSPTWNDAATPADNVSCPSTKADPPVLLEPPVTLPRLRRHSKGKGAVRKRHKRRSSARAASFQESGSVHVCAEAIFLQYEDGPEQLRWQRRLRQWRDSKGDLYDNDALLEAVSNDPTFFRIRVRPGGEGYPVEIAYDSDGYFEGHGAWGGLRVSLEDVRKMVTDPQNGQPCGELV